MIWADFAPQKTSSRAYYDLEIQYTLPQVQFGFKALDF